MVSYVQVERLTKSFGDQVLFSNLSLGVGEGQRIGLIAKNGAGKTTLMEIIAGRQSADSGEVVFRRDLRVSYLEQNPQFPAGITVQEAIFHSDNPVTQTIARYEHAVATNEADAMHDLISEMDALGAWDYEQRCKQILTQLKITDFDQKVEHLSGGQLKRVAMANALITEPEMLMLDEPTNHLDLDMIQWLEEYLRRANITLLMVTHDRYFLDRVCSDIIELDNKQMFSYRGNYSYFLEKRQERLDAASAQHEKDNNLLRKELEWMRRQPQARATKAKSRIDAFYSLEERAKQRRSEGDVRLEVQSGYIGKKIFEVKGLNKSFGEKKILHNFDYLFARGEKLGVVGDNGTGKTTFIKMLMGLVSPDSGTVDIGETVRFGYYGQQGMEFDNSVKVIDVVRDIAEEIVFGNGQKMSASQFLQLFLFTPETQHNFVANLSGGERRRLYLCTILIKNPNFLVLDEPTNDLDIITLNVLEEYLQSFGGCVIVVSHDRYFMDKVVDHLLIFKGEGAIQNFPGNYSDYLDWRTTNEQIERQQSVVAPKPITTNNAPSARNKLTFNDKRELETIESLLPKLETEKAEIEQQLSSGSLSMDELTSLSNRIAELIDLIDEKSMRWLELSEVES